MLKLPRPYGRGFFSFTSSELKSCRSGNTAIHPHDLTIGDFREGGLKNLLIKVMLFSL